MVHLRASSATSSFAESGTKQTANRNAARRCRSIGRKEKAVHRLDSFVQVDTVPTHGPKCSSDFSENVATATAKVSNYVNVVASKISYCTAAAPVEQSKFWSGSQDEIANSIKTPEFMAYDCRSRIAWNQVSCCVTRRRR